MFKTGPLLFLLKGFVGLSSPVERANAVLPGKRIVVRV